MRFRLDVKILDSGLCEFVTIPGLTDINLNKESVSLVINQCNNKSSSHGPRKYIHPVMEGLY